MLKTTIDALARELERLDSIDVADEHLGDEIKRAKAVSAVAMQSVAVSQQVADVVRLRADLAGVGDAKSVEQMRGLLDA